MEASSRLDYGRASASCIGCRQHSGRFLYSLEDEKRATETRSLTVEASGRGAHAVHDRRPDSTDIHGSTGLILGEGEAASDR